MSSPVEYGHPVPDEGQFAVMMVNSRVPHGVITGPRVLYPADFSSGFADEFQQGPGIRFETILSPGEDYRYREYSAYLGWNAVISNDEGQAVTRWPRRFPLSLVLSDPTFHHYPGGVIKKQS